MVDTRLHKGNMVKLKVGQVYWKLDFEFETVGIAQ